MDMTEPHNRSSAASEDRVATALREECLQIFGATWNNDNARRLARAAISALPDVAQSVGMREALALCEDVLRVVQEVDKVPESPIINLAREKAKAALTAHGDCSAGIEGEIRRELADCQGALDTIEANRKPENKTQWGNERFYEGRKRSLEFVLELLGRMPAAPQGVKVPEGYALVPLIPTPEMIEVGCGNNSTQWNDGTDDGFAADVANDVYVSMVRAASQLSRPEHS
jgi:hypothetical protein